MFINLGLNHSRKTLRKSKFTVKKGRHFSLPFTVDRALRSDTYSWIVQLDKSMRYDLKDKTEQKDWNKLLGLKDKYFRSMFNTVMLAWRYNIERDKVELGPYVHNKGKRLLPNEIFTFKTNKNYHNGGSLSVDSWDKILVELKYSKESYTMSLYSLNGNKENQEIASWVFPFQKTTTKPWYINHWFGGTLKAPSTIKMYILKVLH